MNQLKKLRRERKRIQYAMTKIIWRKIDKKLTEKKTHGERRKISIHGRDRNEGENKLECELLVRCAFQFDRHFRASIILRSDHHLIIFSSKMTIEALSRTLGTLVLNLSQMMGCETGNH